MAVGMAIEHRKTIFPLDDVVTRAEVKMCMDAEGEKVRTRRCRKEPFMQYKDGVSTGESLVKAIGLKVALYYVRKEFDSLTEEDVKQEHADFERWSQYCKTRINGMKLETGESCVIHFGKL